MKVILFQPLREVSPQHFVHSFSNDYQINANHILEFVNLQEILNLKMKKK